MKNYKYRKLAWDTKYFGYNSSRIDIQNELTSSDVENIKAQIKSDTFITLTNSKGLVVNNKLITGELRFNLVDVNVQLINKQIQKRVYGAFEGAKIVDDITDKKNVIRIVQESFIKSRFYNDDNISEEKASEIYVNWIQNAFACDKKRFCVYEENGIIEGFILLSEVNEKQMGIELIAVDQYSRDKGIGSKMMNCLYQYCMENSYEDISVGTQIENISAINFYNKNYFQFKDIKYIYHLWSV